MRILNPALTDEGVWDWVVRAPSRALLLDYDGTLAPFSPNRQRAFPYPGIREALERIQAAQSTRMAVVSGRAARDVGPLLGLSTTPEIWGSHGLERLRADGSYESRPADAGIARSLREAVDWIASRGWTRLTESKPFGLALHARGAPAGEFERARQAVLDRWREAFRAAGLEPLEFDGGIEWRPSGRHKGEVVETIFSEMGVSAAVCYLGDDRTDEDTFATLRGRGLGVLVRAGLRPTAADLWLHPPEELLDFLENWGQKTGGRN